MIGIYSSAVFPMTFGHLNKNSSCTSDYSHQPRVFIVITLLIHIREFIIERRLSHRAILNLEQVAPLVDGGGAPLPSRLDRGNKLESGTHRD